MDEFSHRVHTAHGDSWQAQGRLRAPYGGGAAERHGIRLMASGIPETQWNNGDVTAPDADVEGARAFYAALGVPWGVRVPAGMPWAHGRRLFSKRLMGMPAAAFRPAPPVPGLVIRAAGAADLEAVVQVDAAAFGSDPELGRVWMEPLMPARECSVALALLDGRPVATGYGLSTRGPAGACVYVAGIAVLGQARGRGVGSHVSSWLLDRGFADGAELAVLHPASDPAARLYARLGFRETAPMDVYVDV